MRKPLGAVAFGRWNGPRFIVFHAAVEFIAQAEQATMAVKFDDDRPIGTYALHGAFPLAHDKALARRQLPSFALLRGPQARSAKRRQLP